MIALALAHAETRTEQAWSRWARGRLSWPRYEAIRKREHQLRDACSKLVLSQPQAQHEWVIARLQKDLKNWQLATMAAINVVGLWQRWAEELLTEAGLHHKAEFCDDEQARKLLGKLVRKAMKK